MKQFLTRLTFAALALGPWGMARANTVHGTVKNATTGKNAPGIELALLQPMSGMQEVAHSKSGPQGEFTFDHPGLGTQPMLVQAIYQGMHFNQMVPPGRDVVEVDIYEPSKELSTIEVPSRNTRSRTNPSRRGPFSARKATSTLRYRKKGSCSR